MKKVRLIFAGVMLVFVSVGFTSCTHNSEDMDPVLIENSMKINLDNSKSDSGDEGEKEGEGGGSSGTGPG